MTRTGTNETEEEFQIRVAEDGSVTRLSEDDSDGLISTTATSDSVELQAVVGHNYDEPYLSDDTVNISVSAVNTSADKPTAVGNVNITVTVSGPNNTVVTRTVTSDSSGAIAVPIDLSTLPNGTYDVEVSSPDVSSTDHDDFIAGPSVNLYPRFTDHVEVGQPVTVAASLAEQSAPVTNTTFNVSIRAPDGNETTKTLTTDTGGFATFEFTPNQTGRYWVTPANHPGDSTTLTGVDMVAELKTDTRSYSTYLPAGGSAQISGVVYDEGAPLANTNLVVRIINTTNGVDTTVENLSVTTNAQGLYATEWQTPDKPNADFEAHLYTTANERIVHDGGRINLEASRDRSGGEGSSGPTAWINTEIQSPSYRNVVAPGGSANATIETYYNGSIAPNTTVDYALTYEWTEQLATTGTVTTNATGQATISVPIPADAPDSASFDLKTWATINGTNAQSGDDGEIQRYRIEEDRLGGNTPGNQVGFELRFVDPETDTGVSGIPVSVAAETFTGMQGGVFGTGAAVSGADGSATVNFTLPSHATREFLYGPRHPYFDGGFPTEDVEGYDITVNGLSREIEGGDTVTLNYTAASPDQTTAVVMFTTWESGQDPGSNAKVVQEGEEFTMTAPDVPAESNYRLQVYAINESGVTASESDYLDIIPGSGTTDDSNSNVTVAGRITKADGTAAVNATVAFDPTSGSGPLPIAITNESGFYNTSESTQTNDDPLQADTEYDVGVYQLNLSEANSNKQYQWARDGTADVYAVDTINTSTDSNVSAQLPDGHLLNVTVTNESGAPVTDANVLVLNNRAGATVGGSGLTNSEGAYEYWASGQPGIEVTGNVSVKVTPPENSTAYETQTLRQQATVTNETTLEFTLTENDSSGATKSANMNASVRAVASPASAQVGETVTVDLVAENASEGVGAFESTLKLANESIGTIENVSIVGSPDTTDITRSANNTTVSIAAFGLNRTQSDDMVLARVNVTLAADGSSDIVVADSVLGTPSADDYTIMSETGTTLTTTTVEPIGSSTEPPTDVDGDGTFEDINGDGNVTVSDVQAMFANRDSPVFEDNVDKFDFSGNGDVNIVDVQRLFVEVTA
ncbi:hypothetical protein [Haloferax profundi]|uniref:Dockerin domain-containing protein n=1 Tax=Haloferax profundi TaxID=1544718 RepID=A0A0W1RX45_9EURY|nr:hypothetical protein [Haloferax profundi]KTG18254.1 hypothetical protein AUR66_18260 [Haloferax profundi]